MIHEELTLILENAVRSDNVHIKVLLLSATFSQENLVTQDALEEIRFLHPLLDDEGLKPFPSVVLEGAPYLFLAKDRDHLMILKS